MSRAHVSCMHFAAIFGFTSLLGSAVFAQSAHGPVCPVGYHQPGTICGPGESAYRHRAWRRHHYRHSAGRYREERLSSDFGGARRRD
jgi:hypothetical protein